MVKIITNIDYFNLKSLAKRHSRGRRFESRIAQINRQS